jgi:hypothetical protein
MLRVLATSGIATGEAIRQGELKQFAVHPLEGGDLLVHLAGAPSEGSGSWMLPAILRASVLSPTGASVIAPEIRWYDDRGVEVGRGRAFNLHDLPKREPADAKARQFKIRTSTLDALDACVPSGQKSAFVSEAIDVAIRRPYVKR